MAQTVLGKAPAGYSGYQSRRPGKDILRKCQKTAGNIKNVGASKRPNKISISQMLFRRQPKSVHQLTFLPFARKQPRDFVQYSNLQNQIFCGIL